MRFTALFVLGAAASFASSQTFVYDASFGSLPQAQGWNYVYNNGTAPNPVVVNGALHQGPTNNPVRQYWDVSPAQVDFNLGVSIFARLNVTSSNYYNDGSFKRAGWNFLVSDDAGRFILLGISSSRIHLRRADGTAGVETNFDTTGAFHDYELNVLGNTATLKVDGNQLLTTTVSAAGAVGARRLDFGDSSILGNSETHLRYLRATIVPEPATLAVLGLGGLIAMRRRRR